MFHKHFAKYAYHCTATERLRSKDHTGYFGSAQIDALEALEVGRFGFDCVLEFVCVRHQ
jgi:hypothetical protein